MMPEWFSRLSPAPERPPVMIEELAWPDLRPARSDVLLLPVGALEQHGPHLPLNTDTVIARATCAYASATTGAAVLPALPYTVSLGHTEKWPGTFALFHETLIHTVREIARWAVASGWKRVLILNSHFGNDAPLRCAVDRLRFDFPGEFFVALSNSWQLTPEIHARFTHDAADWHANEAETSLLMFLSPGSVRLDRLAASDDPDRTVGCIFPHLVAHTSSNGVTGVPSLATPERGAALIRDMGEALSAVIRQAAIEEPPLAWSRTAGVFAA
jgi:creatinine amidohydrolase